MSFDAQAIFADLAEKERIKGHHSAEGRAIRTLSRALNGYSCGNLSGRDVVVLCDQAIEDWLKAKNKVSPWSARGLPELLAGALHGRWISRLEALRLQKLRNLRQSIDHQAADVPALEVESTVKSCIQIVEKHW